MTTESIDPPLNGRGQAPTTPYEAGYDSVVSGANTTNCSYAWFNTPERTAEWERGVREAKARLQERSVLPTHKPVKELNL